MLKGVCVCTFDSVSLFKLDLFYVGIAVSQRSLLAALCERYRHSG